MKRLISISLLIVILCACGTSAKIEKSWRDPATSVDVTKLNKVLLVALLNSEANRRSTEDKLAAMLNGKGVPSYLNYLTRDIKKDDESTLTKKMQSEGFDGAVIMRLVDVEKDERWVQGSYPPTYNRFWGYYWNYSNAFYDQGHYQTTKTYTVETNVYSFRQDKLVWSGITTSVDPSDLNKLMDATAETVFKEMKKQGFIKMV
jgi:hypothetical protein